MTVLILAAGYATRLYPLTLDMPKPLLTVGQRSIIERIFAKIAGLSGIEGRLIITNRKFFSRFKDWAAGFKFDGVIEVIDDESSSNETRLGAIRDIEFAVKKMAIKGDLLVIGGDNIFEFSLRNFAGFAERHKPFVSLAVFDIGDIKKAGMYGVVKLDASDRVVDFEEKPAAPKSTLISTCVYYFPKEKLGKISDFLSSGNKADAPGNYIKWLSENDGVYGFVFKEGWYDIGDLKSLKEADEKYSV